MQPDQSNLTSQPVTDLNLLAISPKNKKIGLFLLIGPIVCLVAVFMVYAIVAFIGESMGQTLESPSMGISIARVILGFLGLVCAIAFIVGIPLGIIFLNKKELISGIKYDERSGNKGASVVPEEIRGWNWGAAGLTWIWGLWHGVWISLLFFIPVINIIMVIVMGIKGSEWAWKAQKWQSVESFTASQKKWKPWGILFFILMILGLVSNLF